MLAHSFAEGARQHNDVKVISVADHKVNPCSGCNYCYTSEGHRCIQNDDMNEIYDALRETDVLAVASPVYFYGISAELKAIIDRLHTPMRDTFPIKKAALLLVGATRVPKLFDPIVMQYNLTLEFFQIEDLGSVLVSGVKNERDISGNDSLKTAYDLGSSISDPLATEKR